MLFTLFIEKTISKRSALVGEEAGQDKNREKERCGDEERQYSAH